MGESRGCTLRFSPWRPGSGFSCPGQVGRGFFGCRYFVVLVSRSKSPCPEPCSAVEVVISTVGCSMSIGEKGLQVTVRPCDR